MDDPATGGLRLDRRHVLVAGAGGLAITAVAGGGTKLLGTITAPSLEPAAEKAVLGDLLTIQRPADQLRLRIQLVNLKRSGQRLVAIQAGQPSYLRIYLPAQHVGEEATAVAGSARVMRHRVAGESRVVLRVQPPTPFTVSSLLTWHLRALVLDPRAHPEDIAGAFPTGAPAADTTVLVLPEGLHLSPDDETRFLSRVTPLTRGGVTEEWTARLQHVNGLALTEPSVTDPVSVRAIWTPGYAAAPTNITAPADPFTRPLTSVDRKHLVRAMGDQTDLADYPNHEAARAQRLWLGASGGWLDAEGTWEGSGLVSAWAHRAVTGRDASVTIVSRGFLAPFGTAASIAVVSERVFATDSTGARVAHLERKEFLVISEAPVTTPRPFAPFGDRRSLFTSLSAGGVHEIVRGQINQGGAINTNDAFVPESAPGVPLQVAYRGVDRTGRRVTFSSTVAWVSIEHAFDPGAGAIPARVVTHLRAPSTAGKREVDMGGQQLAFADEVNEGDGSTTMRAISVVFDSRGPTNAATEPLLEGAGQPAFFPSVEIATVRDDNSEAVGGAEGAEFEVEHADGWLQDGNTAANFGAVFLSMPNPSGLDFGGDLGGLMSPSLNTGQIGQAIGRSVELPAPNAEWDPAAALKTTAKLFGSIPLEWLIDAFNVGADLVGDIRLPRFDFDLEFSLPEIPSEICQRFDWEPTPKSVMVGGTKILCIQSELEPEPDLEDPFDGPSTLALHVKRCVSLDPDTVGEIHDTVEFSLTNVALQFPPGIPFLVVYVERLRYLDLPDAPPDVDVAIKSIALIGPLNFLDALVDLLPASLGGFGVDVLDDAIDVALDLRLPSINLGVFGLTDLSLGVGVDIPFGEGATSTSLSLGTRENPFQMTVMGIGGFGSIEIEAAPHPVGLIRVEVVVGVVFEIAIDVVVARGSISAAFSLGLEVEKVPQLNDATQEMELVDETTLTAALECVGEVEVLGIITLTIEFLLTLEYRVQQRLLVGEVTITVEVDAAIVKKEVRFSVQQEFSLEGDGARPALNARRAPGDRIGFADRFETSSVWSLDYCGAFA